MFGEEMTSINSEIQDAVGEISNMNKRAGQTEAGKPGNDAEGGYTHRW